MHSISIAIPTEAADRLRELARRERRSPRQQAAVLVLAGLEREGTGAAPTPAAGFSPRPATRPSDAPEGGR
jgi:hypothetical protein